MRPHPRSNLGISVNNIVENSQNILNYLDALKESFNKLNDNTEVIVNNINPTSSIEYFSSLSKQIPKLVNYIRYVKDFIYVLVNKIHALSENICELETQRKNMKQCHNKMSDEIYRLNKKITEQEEEIKTLAEICKDSLNQENTCNICFTRAKTHINTFCGHKAVCYSCSEKLENKCPICRCNGNFIRVIST